MASKKLNHPSLLSVIRAHNVSVFPMYGVPAVSGNLFDIDIDKALPVEISRETVRGTQSAAATKEAKRGVPNIQAVDFAVLPSGTDTLLTEGNVLVTGKGIVLDAVNDVDFKAVHTSFVSAFEAKGGYVKLAERFVMNLLNGSILFRNRVGSDITCAIKADDVEVQLHESQLSRPGSLSAEDIVDSQVKAKVAQITQMWADALTGKRHALTLAVRASVVMGVSQEVYPSQEFTQGQGDGEGRVLARAPRNDGIQQAAFHGRKIGNALRTIDTWYPDATKALPVEPYGVDQSAQAALRSKGSDFYSLMMKMPELTTELESGTLSDNALYVGAVFLRGGVFSKKADKS